MTVEIGVIYFQHISMVLLMTVETGVIYFLGYFEGFISENYLLLQSFLMNSRNKYIEINQGFLQWLDFKVN